LTAVNQGLNDDLFAFIEHSVANTPYYLLVGIELDSLAPGRAALKATTQPQHGNPMGLVHGGLLSSIADAAMGNAIRSLGHKAVTVDMSIAFTASARLGDALIARGKVIKSGKNLFFTEANVFAGENIIAHAKGTFFRLGNLEY